jgi:hypothetical protein
MKYLFRITLLVALGACGPTDKEEKGSKDDGVDRAYREDGSLYSEMSYKDKKLHGICKTYHSNGKVFREETYANDKKHGKFTQYYQDGTMHSEMMYDSGKIDGIVRRYHKDGKLKAEAPFKKGCECLGLKEYILNGDPRPHYPEIVIKTEDKLLSSASYYIHLSLTERVRKVEFFKGYLKEGCLHDGLESVISDAKNTGRIGYTVIQGEFVMERINVVAKIETIAGNILVTQRSYNVAIDFPRF